MQLRDWQAKTLPQGLGALSVDRTVMLTVPTAAGKTIISAFIGKEYKRVLFVCDRLILITQTIATFASLGISCDVMQGNTYTKNDCQVLIASQQTLIRRDLPPDLDLIIIDEAHCLTEIMKEIILTVKIPVLGLSATPFTPGLDLLFNNLLCPVTAHKLTMDGILVPLKVYTFVPINMLNARTIAGEYTASTIRERSAVIQGDVVDSYLMCGQNSRTICFCASIAHCEDIAAQFRDANVPVGIYTSKTSRQDREKMLDDFDNKRIMILITVEALSKGFDRKCVDMILDLRPLKRSFGSYMQMIGRGLRSMPGKTHCTLLDFSGNMQRFKDDYEDLYYNGVSSLKQGEYLNRVRPTISDEVKESTRIRRQRQISVDEGAIKLEVPFAKVAPTPRNAANGIKLFNKMFGVRL